MIEKDESGMFFCQPMEPSHGLVIDNHVQQTLPWLQNYSQ